MAAVAVVGLISSYSSAVLRSKKRGLLAATLLGSLYAYLLTLLSLEEYALLAGSCGLFIVLGATMYLTRWVDWEQIAHTEAAGPA